MAVHNEEKALAQKLGNLANLDYPQDRYEIIVISDGSTDATNQILSAQIVSRLRTLILPERQGKAVALNRGIEVAEGEILVFTDARQLIEAKALRYLVGNFADPEVGCVGGELVLADSRTDAAPGAGVGLYWRLEKKIREWEGAARSVVGASGCLYAVRKRLIAPLPTGTILDDVYLPLLVARQGGRVVLESRALAFDRVATGQREFWRKVRTLAGNYQLIRIAPWLLTGANPVRLEFVCHKLLRLLVPFALAAVFVSSLSLKGAVYELALALQVVFYAMSALTIFRRRLGVVSRLAEVSLAFLLLNMAAVVAFLYFVTGRKAVWIR
jgi:cellulose synthase/poly-beta-1,6-N-acetylglucosamine synthase-like glycosyltransferase